MRPGAPAPGAPGTRAKSFGPTLRRLLRRLAPERLTLVAIGGLAITAVVLNVLGPQLLGKATNLIFDGVVGRQLPAGSSNEQAIEGLRAAGRNELADMLGGMHVIPGAGIDFGSVGRVLLLVLALYLGAAVCSWLQAYLLNLVINRTVQRVRADIEDKIHRLPLRYFDSTPRGDLLSRVTNDVDNMAQSLNQTMSQMVISVLSVLGILIMMFWISPPPAP